MRGRTRTRAGDLARRGFSNAERATRLVDALTGRHPDDGSWLDLVADSADPDLALQGLAALDETVDELLDEVFGAPDWLARLVTVLGGSQALNLHLRAHPDHIRVLADEPEPRNAEQIRRWLAGQLGTSDLLGDLVLADPMAADQLRLANKAALLRIAARDLCHPEPAGIVDDIARELTGLADAVMAAALAIARAEVPDHARARLAIIALGKCGAGELNYLSDVDMVYVAEPADALVGADEALQVASQLAAASARICSAHSTAGTIWQVDAALRPEGNAGALVRTLSAYRTYYDKWAQNWELQAMLKARPMAGDMELGGQFVEMVAPLVWRAGGKPNFMAETQAMRRRVISLIPAREREREIKLGAGGLRDVEFSVQLLQLVHGRADDRLRQPGTLQALDALVEHGYIGRSDGAALALAYRHMRVLEHREQLFRLRRTHLMPTSRRERRRLARQVGALDADAVWQDWRALARQVQQLQQRVFYSPLLAAVSRISSADLQLSPEQAADRLRAMGFSDPVAALRHIEALTTGLSRTAKIQQQLMPAMLRWFSEGPNPDLGLLGFRRLSDEMGTTSWYMRALRDEGWMAERLARILSSSRYVSDLLRRDPAVVQLLGSDVEASPRTRDDLNVAFAKIIGRHEVDSDAVTNAVAGLRRRELFRLAAGDVLGRIELAELGQGLADLTSASVQAGLQLASEEIAMQAAQRGEQPAQVPLGVVAMGRWGGAEMGFASDADALFVVADRASPDQLAWAESVVARMRALLGAPDAAPTLEIDAGLRPEGRNGPLVRTASSYLAYYAKWSQTWESQALLRAGYGAGDEQLVADLLDQLAFRRYPGEGLGLAQVTEIRRLKGRMEKERAGRGSLGQNLKLGPGGLSDVEWAVQLLQLQHVGRIPELRVTGTMPALQALLDADLVSQPDATALRNAWQLASQLRNRTMLVRGRPTDMLPSDPRETASVAMLLGFGPGQASLLMDYWAKTARHAAQVVDRLFWGGR
ncbi:MAG: bifunctional [glutamine synthetase] adenylyltransferase/[glutamine synthetase]-adenylyl-L-tyrosine phosphorylase [Brooklawnia sp.]